MARIPCQAKAALVGAGASPAVKRFVAPVVDVGMLAAKRATDVTDRQRLWFLDLQHVLWTSSVASLATLLAEDTDITFPG